MIEQLRASSKRSLRHYEPPEVIEMVPAPTASGDTVYVSVQEYVLSELGQLMADHPYESAVVCVGAIVSILWLHELKR